MSGPTPSSAPTPPRTAGARAALAYHERSKHHPGHYARALGFLDWDSQPDPYRTWIGAPRIALPRPAWDPATGRTAEAPAPRPADLPPEATRLRPTSAAASTETGAGTGSGVISAAPRDADARWPRCDYDALYHAGAVTPRALDAVALSALFWNSLALSATKSIESARWSLRVNPSSGNLHPTEAWLLLGDGAPLRQAGAGLYHYAPREHALERRASYRADGWSALTAGLPDGAALLALSSIPWRESWKYGERAWRYCQHDVGHALAGLRLSAALLGWRLTTLADVDDGLAARLLGLDRADEQVPEEPEHPDLLLLLETLPRNEPDAGSSRLAAWRPAPAAVTACVAGPWHGRAAPLSPPDSQVSWPVIDEVERACRKTPEWCERTRLSRPVAAPAHPLPRDSDADVPDAESVLRTRRSAVAMDGTTGLTRAGFQHILRRCLPAGADHPWDALAWPTGVHLGVFVHRVADVEPGLYLLARAPDALESLRAACPGDAAGDFAWQPAPGSPPGLPLFLLRAGDMRRHAAGVSCGQDIAADGAFALAMLADVSGSLARHGAPTYRHLFWECGAIGQVLYLEARAHGVSATGIGCFFDDPTHRLFGLDGKSFQSLYHFTVGGARDDERLTSEAPYAGA